MRNLRFKVLARSVRPDFLIWWSRGFKSPSPSRIKIHVLSNYSFVDSVWFESGTYLGETTKRLSLISSKVYSSEPDQSLFEFSRNRLKKFKNIHCYLGSSEDVLPNIIGEFSGPVNFWLDGHFSGDVTYKGEKETPIIAELKIIEKYLANWKNAAIFVDDVRNFVSSSLEKDYPSLDFLVNFALKNHMTWTIEQDIFVCWK
jgi:hypothetical protein